MVNDSLALKNQQNDLQLVGIANKPVKYCSVTLSDVLARGKRLEASVFNIEAIQARESIIKSKYGYTDLLSCDEDIIRAYHSPRFKREYIEKNSDNAVGFLGSSEMLDIKPVPSKYITKKQAEDLQLYAKPGTVLLSCSGTIGNISFVSDTLTDFALSQHIIRIECKNYGGFLYTGLKHPYIQAQLMSQIYGSVIQELEPEHLALVCFPKAPSFIKQKIHDLIVCSYKLRDESNRLLDQAEEMLINELHLPDISDFNVNLYRANAGVDTFSVKLSDIAGRIDASYHVPIADAIVDHMNKFSEEVTTIGDPRISKDVILPSRFKRVYVDEEYGVRFLGGKEIHQLDPSTEKYLSKKAHRGQIEKELGIKPYSILTPARGSLGDVELPCDHFIGWAISDNMMQIVSNKEMCGYIFTFLNTEYGKTLIRRFTYGGVVDAIEPEHIKQVEIPFLKDKILQQAINELALRANKRRYEAYKLEQQALRIMDEEVIFAK